MPEIEMHGDAIVACADLIGRCGASSFEIGYHGSCCDGRCSCTGTEAQS